jgi:hypothetical protein
VETFTTSFTTESTNVDIATATTPADSRYFIPCRTTTSRSTESTHVDSIRWTALPTNAKNFIFSFVFPTSLTTQGPYVNIAAAISPTNPCDKIITRIT